MNVKFHSGDVSTALAQDNITLREAGREARAALYTVMERLEMNDLSGEETPFVDDCLVAIAMLEEALR